MQFQRRESDKNLGIDDDGSTNGDEGGHCVKAEGDAQKWPAHLKKSEATLEICSIKLGQMW